jgi:dTDP-4-dehydrorhamnose 3,5-epimerase
MKIHYTPLKDLFVVETDSHKDSRGEFSRIYCEHELYGVIGDRKIVQMNISRTRAIGTVRGMHFQIPPHAEMKLVRCQKGRIWDVVIDIRKGSPTFLRWYAEELSENNNRIMVISEGFAHGFQVLEDDSELLYAHTAFFSPSSEVGIRFDDPALAISWPLIPTGLSPRDTGHPNIDSNFCGVEL